jgi:type IV pilus assembly protein PilV
MNKRTMHQPKHPSQTAGFTLVEVLVAVVVLAVGLLGMAGLQVAGLHFNHSAYLRAQATLMAYDMAERMKANPVGLAANNYNNQAAPGADIAECLTVAGCTPADMAQHDLFEWNTTLSRQLPGGKGAVCIDSTPNDANYDNPAASCDGVGSIYVIKIGWQDERATGGREEKKEMFETSAQL